MLIENSFEVPAPLDVAWPYLLDVERVVVCMPGAELTETVDDRNWKGRVKVKLGPVSLAFAGKVTMTERDDDAHRVVLSGAGMEQRGKGRASVTVTTTAEETPNGTRISVVQELQVQGQVASMSRGMMQDVTSRLTKQFAECLEANLQAEQPAAAAPERRAQAAGPPPAEGDEAAVAARASAEQGAPVHDAPTPSPQQASASAARPSPAARAGEVRAFSLLLGAIGGAIRRAAARLLGRFRKRP
jgi:carbon monoxide dehydrogenase subunit G